MPKYSRLEGKTLVESPKIIAEMQSLGLCETIFIADANRFVDVVTRAQCDVYEISDSVAKHLAQTETTTGIFAIVRLPQHTDAYGEKVVILDGIQDPSNFGAICRSAAAFGYNTIVAINSCYAYSPKVVRTSMGTVFRLNIVEDMSYDDIEMYTKSHEIELICCDMTGISIENSRPKSSKFGIIIGSEGRGVSARMRSIATTTISVPMTNGVESLNASVSAGIIMFYLK